MLPEWLLFSFLGPLQVLGHGNMMWPPTWFDPNGTIGLTPGGFMHGDYETAPNMWFTNWTFIPGKPTLDPSLYSMPDFHGSAYEVWDKVHCFTSSGYGDVCLIWYPTYPVEVGHAVQRQVQGGFAWDECPVGEPHIGCSFVVAVHEKFIRDFFLGHPV